MTTQITDEYMQEMLPKAKAYSIMLLKRTPKLSEPGAQAIVGEHGRRNFALRLDGVMPIVCPTTDEGELAGLGIFDAGLAEVSQIMDEDPGVKAGIFTYEVHPCRGFPGSALPD